MVNEHAHEPIQRLATPTGLDPAKVVLGRRLFSDARLSRDNTISCASCHDVTRGGDDGRRVAKGFQGNEGLMNTPTVFNADFNPRQFWDGRVDSLEAQVDGPLQHPDEMASTWPEVLAKVRRDGAYAAAFRDRYRDGVTAANIKDAIATYERTLVTPNSRFDRYLAGDDAALSKDELAGYRLFKSYGCVSCHQGRNAGGNLFEPLGVLGDYFADRGAPLTKGDLGRFNVTGRPEDMYRFRVPSLRLVADTAPYFHDGRVATLELAIVLMGKYQLGQDIPPADVDRIAQFLGTLAGVYDEKASYAAR